MASMAAATSDGDTTAVGTMDTATGTHGLLAMATGDGIAPMAIIGRTHTPTVTMDTVAVMAGDLFRPDCNLGWASCEVWLKRDRQVTARG